MKTNPSKLRSSAYLMFPALVFCLCSCRALAQSTPPIPLGLVASGGDGQIALSWSTSDSSQPLVVRNSVQHQQVARPNTDVAPIAPIGPLPSVPIGPGINQPPTYYSYNIYRGTTPGGENTNPVANSSTTSYADSAVTNGITYYYQVTTVQTSFVGGISNAVRQSESAQSAEVSATPNAPVSVSPPRWPIQFGSAGDDGVERILTDRTGAVYVAGSTSGNLFGTNAGDEDCYIAKYDNNGNLLWGKQFGSSNQDYISSVAVDSNNNLIVVGGTSGNLFGAQGGSGDSSSADGDAFVAKFSSTGSLIWSKQLGTQQVDSADGVAVDSQNNIYVIGSTSGSLFGTNNGVGSSDVFLTKYDGDGNQLWSKQFGGSYDTVKGSSEDLGEAIALDNQGNIYVGGMTDDLFDPNTNGYDAFVAKLDPSGNILWGKQFGTEERDEVRSIRVDSTGDAYVAGDMNQKDDLDGDPNYDPGDGFVGKFDPNGSQLWMHQWSTPSGDSVGDVILDNQGNVYAIGGTEGSLFGVYSGNGGDAAIAKYDPNGNVLWSNQYSTNGGFNSAAIDSQGNLFFAGGTVGSPFGPSAGGDDIFIQKLNAGSQMASLKRQMSKLAKFTPDAFGVKGPKRRNSTDKALAFAWNGKTTPLNLPPLLIAAQPYMYVGYLRYDMGKTKITLGKYGNISIIGKNRQINLHLNDANYQLNGQPQKMAGKPILKNGRCYVPLDVMRKVLPVSVRYEAEAKQVRFDPPRMAMR